jgi:hypothetical protein
VYLRFGKTVDDNCSNPEREIMRSDECFNKLGIGDHFTVYANIMCKHLELIYFLFVSYTSLELG